MKKFGILAIFFVLASLFSWSVFGATTTIRPESQGYYANWLNKTCPSGTGEWLCVQETTANTTDYVYTNSKNVKETFNFQDTSLTTQTINSVSLFFYAQRYSSTRYKMSPVLRINSGDYLGSMISLTSSYLYYNKIYSTNPATGQPWTAAEVNNLEAGMATNTTNQGGMVAQVYAVVDYNPIPDSCNDTDGGNYIDTYGTTSGYLSEVSYSHNDYCADFSNINEYYCSGNHESSQQQNCGTDGYTGSNFCQSGDVYKNYTDYYCTGGACGSNITAILQEDCTEGCLNGACVYYSDLIIDSISFFEYDYVNETNGTQKWVNVTTTVKNMGVANATNTTTKLVRIFRDTNYVPTIALAPNATEQLLESYECYGSAHYYNATADYNYGVAESNETNNAMSVYIDCIV